MDAQYGEEEAEGVSGEREEEEELPPQREFSAGERSVVVLDNGGLRVVVPRPELVGDEYFEREAEEEEDVRRRRIWDPGEMELGFKWSMVELANFLGVRL